MNQLVDRYLQLLAPHMKAVVDRLEDGDWPALRRAVAESVVLRDLGQVRIGAIEVLQSNRHLKLAGWVIGMSELEFAALVEVVEASREYVAPTTQPAT